MFYKAYQVLLHALVGICGTYTYCIIDTKEDVFTLMPILPGLANMQLYHKKWILLFRKARVVKVTSLFFCGQNHIWYSYKTNVLPKG